MSAEKKRRIPLEEARALAGEILRTIGPLVSRAEVAGSVRRLRPHVHDVDIVVIPKAVEVAGTPFFSPVTPFPAEIAAQLRRELGGEVLRKGDKLLQMLVRGVQVDVYASTPEAWGVHLLRWTGSKAHNVYLCNRAVARDLKLAVSVGVMRDGEVIASRTEEDVFRALGLDYVPPEERW